MTAATALGLNGTMFVELDAATYFCDPCLEPSLTASVACAIVNASPLHGWAIHPRFGASPLPPTPSTDRGDLIHALMLGKGKTIAVIKAKNYQTNAAKTARDEARAAGKVPVLEDAYDDAQSVCRIAARRLADDFGIKLSPKKSELGMLWVDKTTHGVPVQCRGLLDNFTGGVEYDIKTIAHVTRKAITDAITDHGAHVQRAAYRRGLEANLPKMRGRIQQRLLFIETHAPFDVVPVRLSPMFLELGEMLWQRAIDTFSQCVLDASWPGVLGDEDVMTAEPPAWYVSRFET